MSQKNKWVCINAVSDHSAQTDHPWCAVEISAECELVEEDRRVELHFVPADNEPPSSMLSFVSIITPAADDEQRGFESILLKWRRADSEAQDCALIQRRIKGAYIALAHLFNADASRVRDWQSNKAPILAQQFTEVYSAISHATEDKVKFGTKGMLRKLPPVDWLDEVSRESVPIRRGSLWNWIDAGAFGRSKEVAQLVSSLRFWRGASELLSSDVDVRKPAGAQRTEVKLRPSVVLTEAGNLELLL